MAAIPCRLQRRSANGGYEAATDHPLYDLLSHAPNKFQTSLEFREWVGFKLALGGNAYVFVSRDTKGRAIELIPLADNAVTVSKSADGSERLYRINTKGKPIYTSENVWHLKGASLDTITGLSPQHVAARCLGLTVDIETFAENLFRNGARPSGVLSTEQNLKAIDALELRALWDAQQSSVANAHRTALLTNGLKFQAIQTTANDAQFIEARRYQTEEICRTMRVDPVMVYQATGGASYASIEQKHLAHLTHTLKPWFARFEQSAEVSLLTRDEQRAGYRVHLDDRNLSLATANDRATYYAQMRQNGLMTINECRDHEGLERSNDPLADKLQPSANLFGILPNANTNDTGDAAK